ncbi:MAG: hypothetical protein R3C56_19680 [Pirellulaceae bacterium]
MDHRHAGRRPIASEQRRECSSRRDNCPAQSGVVLDAVEGTEGSYTLKPEDLYVRAKIVKVGQEVQADWESRPAAWTQPYR